MATRKDKAHGVRLPEELRQRILEEGSRRNVNFLSHVMTQLIEERLDEIERGRDTNEQLEKTVERQEEAKSVDVPEKKQKKRGFFSKLFS